MIAWWIAAAMVLWILYRTRHRGVGEPEEAEEEIALETFGDPGEGEGEESDTVLVEEENEDKEDRENESDDARTLSVSERSEEEEEFLDACIDGDLYTVRRLLEEGGVAVDCRQEDGGLDGYTALMIAATYGHIDIVKLLLLEHGADVNASDPWLGKTALHLASELRVVVLLLESLADVNASAHNGDRPLHAAIRNKQEQKVALLLQHGARVDSENAMKYKPIHVLLEQTNEAHRVAQDISAMCDIAQSLVCHGAKWDAMCDRLIDEKDNISLVFRVALKWWEQEYARGVEELTSIPEEILHRGPSTVEHYVQACGASSRIIIRRNVYVVGATGSGKTSLAKSISKDTPILEHRKTSAIGADQLSAPLLEDRMISVNQFQFSFSERISQEKEVVMEADERAQPHHPSGGAKDDDSTIKPSESTRELGILRHHEVIFWDFGGEDAYHVAQSVLLCKRMLYIVCVDLQAYAVAFEQSELRANDNNDVDRFMTEFVENKILRWIRLILARQPNAEFVFAGSKADVLVDTNHRIRKAREDLKKWVNRFADSIESEACDKDRRLGRIHLRSAASAHSGVMERIPPRALCISAKRLRTLEWLEVDCNDQASIQTARNEVEQIIMKSKRSFQMPELYSQVLDAICRSNENLPPPCTVAFLTTAEVNAILRTKLPNEAHNLADEACKAILCSLHDIGHVLWFEDLDVLGLKSSLVLDPLVLIKFACQVVHYYHENDVVSDAVLKEQPLWEDLDPNWFVVMKQLLQNFRVAVSTGTKTKGDSGLIARASCLSVEWSRWLLVDYELYSKKLDNGICVQWEYHFTAGLADTIFAELVIESYLEAYERHAGQGWMFYSVDDQFVCYVVVTRASSTVQRVLRVKAIASESAEASAWGPFEHVCASLEKVLSRYDGLVVCRRAVEQAAHRHVRAGRLESGSSTNEGERGDIRGSKMRSETRNEKMEETVATDDKEEEREEAKDNACADNEDLAERNILIVAEEQDLASPLETRNVKTSARNVVFNHVSNPYLEELSADIMYHLGLVYHKAESHKLQALFGDVKFFITGGSNDRVSAFAKTTAKELGIETPHGYAISPIGSAARYMVFKVGPVLIASHDSGQPSVSILLHEVTKLLEYAGAKDAVYLRMGTSGGVGVEPGTVVVTSEGVNNKMEATHTVDVLDRTVLRTSKCSPEVVEDLAKAAQQLGFAYTVGKTLTCDDFYEGQGRLDGAICDYSLEDKIRFLLTASEAGVRNIEMEARGFAAFCHRLQIPVGVACVALLNRLNGDQITSTHDELIGFEERPARIMLRFVKNRLGLTHSGRHDMSVRHNKRVSLTVGVKETQSGSSIPYSLSAIWTVDKHEIRNEKYAEGTTVLHAMADAKQLCDRAETQRFSMPVFERLEAARDELQMKCAQAAPGDQTRAIDAFTTELVKFSGELHYYCNASIVERVLYHKRLVKTMREIHEGTRDVDNNFQGGLDNLLMFIRGDRMCPMDWKDDFEASAKVFEEAVAELVEAPATLETYKNDPLQALEAITKLGHAQKRNDYLEWNANQPAQRLSGRLKEFSDSDTVIIPDWFVAESDINYDICPFSKDLFGSIHRGTWGSTTNVIVKLLLTDNTDARLSAALRSKLEEAEMWFKMSHPYVLKLLGACHVATPPFLVYEDAPNGDLKSFLANDKTKLWRLLFQSSLAIEYLHSKMVIHGDIRLRNILVGVDGYARLAEFGLMDNAMMSRADMNAARALRWCAPEALKGRTQYASDVYSFGLCLIEALSGETPYEYFDDATVIEHINNNILPPRPENMSDEIWKLVQKMTEPDVSKRSTIKEVTEVLKKLANEELGEATGKIILCQACSTVLDDGSLFCRNCQCTTSAKPVSKEVERIRSKEDLPRVIEMVTLSDSLHEHKASKALLDYVFGDSDHQLHVFDSGAIPVLAKVVKEEVANPDAQVDALTALGCIMIGNKKIVDTAKFENIFEILKHNLASNSERMKIKSVLLLGHLAYDNPENRREFVSDTEVMGQIRAMASSPSVDDLQKAASRALQFLDTLVLATGA